MEVTMAVLMLAVVASGEAAAAAPATGDVLTGARPIWELVSPSDALRAFLEHRAVNAPGAVAVIVDADSAAAVQRARGAIGDLQDAGAKGPFIFATFQRTGVSEPRLLSEWSQLRQAVNDVAVPSRGSGVSEGRGSAPGPLDAVLGVAGISPRGTRIILVTEDGAKGEDGEAPVVADVSRVLRGGDIQLDAWTLGSCNDYQALTNVSRATGGTLGCGDRGEDKQVTLAVRRGQPGPLQVNVDSSVSALHVQVRGRATLTSPSGRSWSLVPEGGMAELSLDRQQIQDSATGRWVLAAVGAGPLDAEVRALSGLDVGVHASLAPDQRQQSGNTEKLKLLEPQGVTISSVKILDMSGRELASAARNTIYNAKKQVARRALSSRQTGEDSEWDVQTMTGKPVLVETTGHNSNGEVFTRVSNLTRVDNIVIQLPPLDIELNPNSQLIVRPGQSLQLSYDVTNNLAIPQLLQFYMRDDLAFLLRVLPLQMMVAPRQTIQVVGYLGVNPNAVVGQTDNVNLYVKSAETRTEMRKGAMVYVQQEQSNDIYNPTIWATWKSTCNGAWDPATCNTNTWTVDFEIQDRDSGLLSVVSMPRGVQFRQDFVSGTRDKVNAYYSASCCSKKIDIVATDLRGNINRQTFDVGSQFLSAGEIAGITVGVLAIILIIVIIVLAIMLCRRRESLRLERRLSSRLAAREGR